VLPPLTFYARTISVEKANVAEVAKTSSSFLGMRVQRLQEKFPFRERKRKSSFLLNRGWRFSRQWKYAMNYRDDIDTLRQYAIDDPIRAVYQFSDRLVSVFGHFRT